MFQVNNMKIYCNDSKLRLCKIVWQSGMKKNYFFFLNRVLKKEQSVHKGNKIVTDAFLFISWKAQRRQVY